MLKESVTPLLVEHYFDLLSSACRQRNRLFSSYQHGYRQLVEWDRHIIHCSDGLLLLADEADSCVQDRISESVLNQGDFFTIALFALALNRDDYLHALLTLACSLAEYDDAVRNMILWAPAHTALWAMLPEYPLYHGYALTVRPDIPLPRALNLRYFTLSKPTVMTAGFLGALHRYNTEHYFSLIESLLAANDASRLAAISSLLENNVFYSHKPFIEQSLYQLTQSSNQAIAEKAAELAVIQSAVPADDYLAFLRQDARNRRLYIKALGWHGCPRHVCELTEYLDSTAYARLSAAALYTLTGASPEKEGWAGDAPPPARYATPRDDEGFPPEDPDAGLTWPDSAAFSVWWRQHNSRFTAHYCYLAGKNVYDRPGLASTVLTQSLPLSCLAARRLSAPLSELMRLPAHAGTPHQLINALKA